MKVNFIQDQPSKYKKVLIGKLWNCKSIYGEFLGGSIGVQKDGKEVFSSVELLPKDRLIIVRNTKKSKEKSPDWFVYTEK